MFSLENFSFHSNKLIQSQAPEENSDRIIEIQNGRIKNLIHISESQNKQTYHPWKDWRYLGMLFLDYFIFRLGNFLYLIAFIIILAFDDQETTIIPSILIFIFFPFYLLQRLMLDHHRINTLFKESCRKTKKIVFGSTNFYRDCTWGDLSVGEIILIKRNEIFPADVLILDSENEECLLETRLVEGNSLPTRKKPIKLTKGNLQEYGKILTGKFQYDPPSSDLTSFKGTLKLKKDPISEELTIQNLGIKGSKLTFTDWIFGIVVYVGGDSKSSHGETKFSVYQNDFINQFFNELNIMTLILIIVACLVCVIRISSNNETFYRIFKQNSMEILFANLVTLIPTSIQTLVESLTFLFKYLLEKKHKSSLLIYSPFKIPYLSQVTHLIMDKGPCLDESGSAIYSLYLPKKKNFFITPAFFEKERNSKRTVNEKNKTTVFQSQSPGCLPTVSRVEPKILPQRKDSVPNEGLCSPMPVRVQYNFSPFGKNSEDQQFFQEDTKENFFQEQNKRNLNPMESLIYDFKKDSNNQSTSNDISSDLKFKISGYEMNELEKMGSFSEILGNTKNIPFQFNEIFLSLLLCHEIRSKEEVKDSNLTSKRNDDGSSMINEFLLPDSKTILQFSEEYQYKFKHQSRIFNKINIYTISINGQQVQYYILGSELSQPDSESTHYRFTVLVKSVDFPDDKSFNNKIVTDLPVIYIRTDDIAFLDFLEMEETEREILKLKMEILKSRGMRFSIFCKKKINSDEGITSYLNYIRNPNISFNFENCELLTVVAIKDKIVKGLRLLVNDFLTIDNKAWLLSNDNEDLVISTGYLLGLLSKDCEIIRLDLPEDSKICGINEAWIKMRSALTKIKKILISKEPQIQTYKSINQRRLTSLITKSQIPINKMKYAVVLNRKTLDIIAKDQDLLSHLVFIANFSRSLIGYRLSPQDKAFLVLLIRQHCPKKPVIMSIGDGIDDNQMSKNAHIAVNMMPKDQKVRTYITRNVFSNFAQNTDILINNYDLLRMMIRVKSLNYLRKIFHITLICYSACFLYVMPFAWYSLFFGVLTNQFISGAFFVVRDVFVINCIAILYFLWGDKFSSLILKGFVWVYHDGRYIKEQIYRIAFWGVFSNIIDSLIVTFMIIYGVDYSASGNILDFDELSSLMQLAVYLIAFFKMTFFLKNPFTMFILSGSIAILSLLFTSLMIDMTKNKIFGWSMFKGMAEVSKQKELLLLLLFIVLFMLMRFFITRDIFYKALFFANYGSIKNYLIKNGIQSIKEINITKLFRRNLREFNLKNINDSIRKIFKNKNMDIIIQDMLNPNEINANESGYHPFTLKFKDPELESHYRSQIIKFSIGKRKTITNIALAMLILTDIGLLLLSYMENKRDHAKVALSCTIYTLLLLFTRILLKFKNFKYYHILPRLLAPAITLYINIALITLSQESSFNSIISMYILIFSIIFHSEYSEVFINYLIYSLILLVLFLVKVCITKGPHLLIISDAFPLSFETPQKVSLILEGLIIVIYEVYGKYKKEQTYRNIFLNERDIKKENKKIGELLSILVPPFMKESLIQGVHSVSEDQGNVTVLFCDICDFDKIIKQEQKGVIKILDTLFRMFDTFCLENDVQKIETVGKTYMACAGLKAVESALQTINNKNSTHRVINLALNMMSYTKKFTFGENCKLSIKIGIHHGPVIAGVIGYHKPQFSLIGDTVNTASRVCSTGGEGVITISKEGYDNIQGKLHGLEYSERLVEAKGKGIILTYQIRKKRNAEDHHNTNLLESKEQERKPRFSKPIPLESAEIKLELLNMAINLKKNIKNGKNTNSLRKTIEVNSPRFFNNKPFSATIKLKENPSDSPRSPGGKYNFQNSLENKSDFMSFTRMFSDLKFANGDENYSNYEKRESLLKLHSTVSKPDQFNMLLYIENEHLKAVKNNNNSSVDKIDKVETIPGQFNINKNETGKRLTNCINLNDDDFFDKLKIEDNSLELLNYNSYFLTINNTNPVITKDYIEKQRVKYLNENWASILVISLIYLINTFLNILKKNDLNHFLEIMLARGIVNSFYFAAFVVFRKKYLKARNMRKVFLILTGITGFELLTEYFITGYTGMENSLEIIIFCMISINFSYLFFLDGIFLLIYLSAFIVLQTLKNPTIEFGIEITLMISSLILIVKSLHVKLLSDFKNFNTLRVNNVKKNQQNNLIVNLLPSHILEKFLRNPNQKLNLTDDFENVTILYADIAGFTKYSSSVSPTQVVALLKDLFTEFDKLCLDNSVYKLYTIGDCYVVLGVIDAEERDYEREALNVVNMGFQMIEKIKEVKKRVSFHDIDMRIGIHTGKIIGGIIGTDIVRYDVYGMDVVIANKMESNGIEGNVCVSEKTREILLKYCMDDFVFEYHKDVHLQSFNQTIKCYRVVDIRNE